MTINKVGIGGITDPVPGTYPYPYPGMKVKVTASATWADYPFLYWTLDGVKKYDNPITVAMDSDHTLTAHFKSDGNDGCPTLFAWNGTDYVDLGVIDIHAEEDVVRETFVGTEHVALSNHKANFRLREGWTGLSYSHSEIDQVKLYAVVDGERRLCPLPNATHSEQGNVLLQLLLGDDYKADIYLLETIDVQFAVPYQTYEIQSYIFIIEGRNIIKG